MRILLSSWNFIATYRTRPDIWFAYHQRARPARAWAREERAATVPNSSPPCWAEAGRKPVRQMRHRVPSLYLPAAASWRMGRKYGRGGSWKKRKAACKTVVFLWREKRWKAVSCILTYGGECFIANSHFSASVRTAAVKERPLPRRW